MELEIQRAVKMEMSERYLQNISRIQNNSLFSYKFPCGLNTRYVPSGNPTRIAARIEMPTIIKVCPIDSQISG